MLRAGGYEKYPQSVGLSECSYNNHRETDQLRQGARQRLADTR